MNNSANVIGLFCYFGAISFYQYLNKIMTNLVFLTMHIKNPEPEFGF